MLPPIPVLVAAFHTMLLNGLDYVKYIRFPFVAVSRGGQQAVNALLVDWFGSCWTGLVRRDPRCGLCLDHVCGILYMQQDQPRHYGCLDQSLPYIRHPFSQLRALKGGVHPESEQPQTQTF